MRKLLCCLSLLLCCSTLAWASHTGVPWGYGGETGPEHWGELSHDFATCKEGMSQSPIDIVASVDIDQPAIAFAYQGTPLNMVNNGHTVQVNYAPGSTITVAGKTYALLQFHFHTQSENAVDGKLFPMEAHLVHKNDQGQLAVVGVLFDTGAKNAFIEQLWQNMPTEAGADVSVADLNVNVTDMLPADRDYYSWSGSLTTPPCTEGVSWMLLKQPVSIAAVQAEKLEQVLKTKNNRPVQSLNGRTVNQ